jgi:single-strand DNA-binding protein
MSNTITITGRLSADPELRFAASGVAMCNISVPDQKRVKNKDTGAWEDASATTWFRVTVFKEAAESLAEHARKGDTVVITGRLITREWTNKDGEVKSSLDVDYATVAVVPSGPKAQRASGGQQSDPWASQPQGGGWNEPAPF